jgi:hypothetical protein
MFLKCGSFFAKTTFSLQIKFVENFSCVESLHGSMFIHVCSTKILAVTL